MTNADMMRQMTDEQLAYFINIGVPNCNSICKDEKSGCAWSCKHKQGEDVLLKWLKDDIDSEIEKY